MTRARGQDVQTVLNQKEDFAGAHIGLGEAEEALGQDLQAEVRYSTITLRICGKPGSYGGERRNTLGSLSELESYYPFADKVDRPAKDNYRTNVEGLMGYPRLELMATIPYSAWQQLGRVELVLGRPVSRNGSRPDYLEGL
jgi:hypothetical protein